MIESPREGDIQRKPNLFDSTPSLYILGRALGTLVAFSGVRIGKIFLRVDFVWGSEETCAAPYNEKFGARALDRTLANRPSTLALSHGCRVGSYVLSPLSSS
jgi:hypothetical protein